MKISSDELNNFYLPVPPLKFQKKIVEEIQEVMGKQEEIKKKTWDWQQELAKFLHYIN